MAERSCQLASSAHCNFRTAGGCDRPAAMDCSMWATPADERARRERVAKIARDAGLASDATVLTPRLDRDLREHAGKLPAEHWTRSDLTAQETLLAWLESKVGVDGAAEVKTLLAERPEEKDGRPETRGDRSGFERVWFWGNSRLSGDDRGQLAGIIHRGRRA